MSPRLRLGSLIVIGLLAATWAVAQERSQGAGKSGISAEDRKHLEGMARADMAEVAAGKLAVSKAKAGEVKKFAQHMVDEHTRMMNEGGKLAKSRGIEPPSGPDQKHAAAMKKLQGLSGDEFDRAYMEQMVKDHQEALALVKETAAKASDSELKTMAQNATSHVEAHLRMAQQISRSPGMAQAGGDARAAKSGSGSRDSKETAAQR